MHDISISQSKDFFLNNGKPFFYLADTVWSVFSNVSREEWIEYLDFRRMQGFNTLQISVLPILNDCSVSDSDMHPFEFEAPGKYDFNRINHKYFENACTMLETAMEKGFVPALVVLWACYVKGTWISNNNSDNIMPLDLVRPMTEMIVKTFSRFKPIYLISGDTNTESDECLEYYSIVLDTVKEISPDAVTTLHVCGGTTAIFDSLVKSEKLDFYMYQSCHIKENQNWSYELAGQYLEKPVKRPIVNGEPCYEGHGHVWTYGRFNAFDIRKATWQSLLAGAKAGIGYGAHGLWSWHRKNSKFLNEACSAGPFDWRTALKLPGAWDVSFAKWIFETYGLYDMECSDLLDCNTPEIRMAATKDKGVIVIYAPYNRDIVIKDGVANYDWTVIDLSDKLFAKAELQVDGGNTTIKMHCFNSDVLYIGKRK